MTSISTVTLPEMAETPLMVNESVWLLGVNKTLKRVAENLELSMHGFNELDSSSLMADATGARASAAVAKYFRESIVMEVCCAEYIKAVGERILVGC